MIQGFTADNEQQLLATLSVWGETAPHRLERRGRQKELEAFVLNRLLKAWVSTKEMSYPVSVVPSEAPDFVIKTSGSLQKIEVTEAVDPKEQAMWTSSAKQAEADPSRVLTRNIDLMNPNRPQAVRDIMATTLHRKVENTVTNSWELLVYLNTDNDSFESAAWRLAAMQPLASRVADFAACWVVSGTTVIDLKHCRILAGDDV